MFPNLVTTFNGYLLIFSSWLSDQNMCDIKIDSLEIRIRLFIDKEKLKRVYLGEMLGTIKDWK